MIKRAPRNQILFALGVCLSLQGVNMMALVKVLVGRNLRILSPAIMILSILLLTDWRRLRSMLFVRLSNRKRLLLLYLTIIVFLALLSDFSLIQPAYGFVYQLIYLFTILALWNQGEEIDGELTVRVFYYFSGLICILAMYLILRNFWQTGEIFFQGLGRDENGSIITRASTGSISILLFAGILAVQPRSTLERVIRFLLLLVSVFVLFVSRRRSVYVYLIAMLAFWIFHEGSSVRRVKRETIVRVIAYVLIIAVIVIALLSFSGPRAVIEHGIESLTRGINTYIGKTADDSAAFYRFERLTRVPKMIVSKSTVGQFLFGYGYMYEWLDVPILQAFLDLGLLGGTLYVLIAIVFPIQMLLLRKKDSMLLLTQLLCISQIVGCFVSGLPYGSAFFPTALLYFIAERTET